MALVISAWLNAHTPRDVATLLARSTAEGCVKDPNTDQVVSDGWCNSVCLPNPNVDYCKGVCTCPEVKVKREKEDSQSNGLPQEENADKPARPKLKHGDSCVVDPSTDQKVSGGWCTAVCLSNPEVDYCKGVCICPDLETETKHAKGEPEKRPAESKEPAPPKPTGDECIPDPQSNQKVNNGWCTSVCMPNPMVDYCKGVCICPKLGGSPAGKARPKEPAPPNPRILGGWTDCGPNSGISDLARIRQRLSRHWGGDWRQGRGGRTGHGGRDKKANCSRLEEQLTAALPDGHTIDDITRGPSYHAVWGANAILPGRFGGSEVAPIEGEASDYKYFWLTFGGQDTDSRNWNATAEQDILDAGAKGAAFDIEGGVTPQAMIAWIKEMRKKHPEWTYVHVPQAADPPVRYDPENGSPDFVAPMMYYGNG